jgi:microcystin-dependent protein
MSDPFLGEIELFTFDYPPKGWVVCAGQLLPIEQNKALFELIGTVFGGDGITNFALPDLRGRTAIGQGAGPGLTPRMMGAAMGEANHLLTLDETPFHGHMIRSLIEADVTQDVNVPGDGLVLAQTTGVDEQGKPLAMNIYAHDLTPKLAMAPQAIGQAGGQVHTNMMPYLVLTTCIALQGRVPAPPPPDEAPVVRQLNTT